MKKFFTSLETYEALLFMLFPVAVWLEAYTIQKMFLWFVTATWGVKAPSLAACYGIYCLISFLTRKVSVPVADERTEKEKLKAQYAEFFCPLLVLFFGWVANFWM